MKTSPRISTAALAETQRAGGVCRCPALGLSDSAGASPDRSAETRGRRGQAPTFRSHAWRRPMAVLSAGVPAERSACQWTLSRGRNRALCHGRGRTVDWIPCPAGHTDRDCLVDATRAQAVSWGRVYTAGMAMTAARLTSWMDTPCGSRRMAMSNPGL